VQFDLGWDHNGGMYGFWGGCLQPLVTNRESQFNACTTEVRSNYNNGDTLVAIALTVYSMGRQLDQPCAYVLDFGVQDMWACCSMICEYSVPLIF